MGNMNTQTHPAYVEAKRLLQDHALALLNYHTAMTPVGRLKAVVRYVESVALIADHIDGILVAIESAEKVSVSPTDIPTLTRIVEGLLAGCRALPLDLRQGWVVSESYTDSDGDPIQHGAHYLLPHDRPRLHDKRQK